MQADGVIHFSEQAFRDEIVHLIRETEEVDAAEIILISDGEVIIGEP